MIIGKYKIDTIESYNMLIGFGVVMAVIIIMFGGYIYMNECQD